MEALPEKPSETDCCGSGCSPCVFEVYEKLLENFTAGVSYSAAHSNATIRHDLLSPLKYKPFLLFSVEKVNENSNIYSFKPVADSSFEGENPEFNSDDEICGFLPYNPGQHIIMTNSVEKIENLLSISRAYTPTSVAKMQKNCRIQFLIKLYANGAMSSFIRTLSINDVVFLRGPFGDFSHLPNSKYLMICCGTGLAPMISIIEIVLSDEYDETLIRLCFACATLEDVYFREKIRQFSKYWNFEAYIYLSNESDDQISKHSAHNENICSRKITLDVMKEKIFSVQHKVLICGSNSFNKDMKAFAQLCGCNDIFIF